MKWPSAGAARSAPPATAGQAWRGDGSTARRQRRHVASGKSAGGMAVAAVDPGGDAYPGETTASDGSWNGARGAGGRPKKGMKEPSCS